MNKKIAISAVAGLFAGATMTFLFMRNLSGDLDNDSITDWQAAEILKGRLAAKGETETIASLIENFIENGICQNDSIQNIYESKRNGALITKHIEEFYFAMEKDPPQHVQAWIEEQDISYDGFRDCFTEARISISQIGNASELLVKAVFKNRSNLSWTDLQAVATVQTAAGDLITESTQMRRGAVNSREDVEFSFT